MGRFQNELSSISHLHEQCYRKFCEGGRKMKISSLRPKVFCCQVCLHYAKYSVFSVNWAWCKQVQKAEKNCQLARDWEEKVKLVKTRHKCLIWICEVQSSLWLLLFHLKIRKRSITPDRKKNWIQLILTRPLTVISSLDAKAWMSITMTPTSAVLISLGLHSVLLSSFSHQSSSYMPTISHWNLEPYMPFLKASQKMTRAHVSLKLPKIIRVSFCLRISNWSLISSLKPAGMKNNAFSQCPKRTALPRSTLRACPAWLGEGFHRRARKGKESNWVTLWGYHSEVIILQLLVFQLRDKVVVSLSKQKKK